MEDTVDAVKFDRLYLKEMRAEARKVETLLDQPNERRRKEEKTSMRATSETIDLTQPDSDNEPTTRVTVLAPALPCRGSKTWTTHSVSPYPRNRTSSKLSFQIFPVRKAQSNTFDTVRNKRRRMDEEGSGSVDDRSVENIERRATVVSITEGGGGCQCRG
jgi:hypothetical protein